MIVRNLEFGTVGKISESQPEGSRFNPWPGQWLNFGRLPFATPNAESEVMSLA